MRNRRVNVYKNTNLNQVVTDYRAGTPLKNVNTQQAYKNLTPNVIPGGHPSGNVKVPLAGTRISRVRAAPIGGYRKTLATATDPDGNPICCTKDETNKNGFTQEIYKDTWTDCSGVCSGDLSGNVARPTRTKKPLIRSGMQYNSSVKKKKYAFSYSQYQKNLRCLSYERSQEKFIASSASGNPGGYNLPSPIFYKKSGCNGCCTCCSRTQVLVWGVGGDATPTVGDELGVGTTSLAGTVTDTTTIYNNNGTPAFYIVVALDNDEPCEGFSVGQTITNRGTGVTYTNSIIWINNLNFFQGTCDGATKTNLTIYNPSNKKFQVQGAVSSGSRLERLKLDTIQSSRIKTKQSNTQCHTTSGCNPSSKTFTLGYRSAKPRFVTNPNEGGAKTAGFVPTRWRQAYLAHGRAIGNIFQRTSSNNISGSLFTDVKLPYPIASIKAGGCCHPPNVESTN